MGFLPDNYLHANRPQEDSSDERRQRYFEPKHLADGETTTLRPCGIHDSGHVIAGWSYFTMEGKPKRTPKFPGPCPDDIGLSYEGKKTGSGEKAKPNYFLSFVALRKEVDEFVIVTFPQKKVREQYEEILAMNDYQPLESGMANFYLTLKRKGTELDTSYTLVPTLKPPSKADEKRWSDAASGIWLPALFVNGDPFGGKPADGRPEGLPPAHRDELGADHEVATTGAEVMPAGW
jgi:hypothetical protein